MDYYYYSFYLMCELVTYLLLLWVNLWRKVFINNIVIISFTNWIITVLDIVYLPVIATSALLLGCAAVSWCATAWVHKHVWGCSQQGQCLVTLVHVVSGSCAIILLDTLSECSALGQTGNSLTTVKPFIFYFMKFREFLLHVNFFINEYLFKTTSYK